MGMVVLTFMGTTMTGPNLPLPTFCIPVVNGPLKAQALEDSWSVFFFLLLFLFALLFYRRMVPFARATCCCLPDAAFSTYPVGYLRRLILSPKDMRVIYMSQHNVHLSSAFFT